MTADGAGDGGFSVLTAAYAGAGHGPAAADFGAAPNLVLAAVFLGWAHRPR